MSMKLTSRAFHEGEKIPNRYSRQGGNISPPLAWTEVPAGARSLTLVADDPDAPSGVFVHWLVYRIPPDIREFDEGSLPSGVRQGQNGFGEIGYDGPQPPSGTHRYFFHLYALDREIDMPMGASREDLDEAIRGHVLEEVQLMGRYGQMTGTQSAR
jgi:Raf kinase inhibitor-like YbhB/YbcL family protein